MFTKLDIGNECNNTATVYKTDYEMIMDYYQEGDYKGCAEIAMALMQLVLTGGNQYSDQKSVSRELRSRAVTAQRNYEKYNAKKEKSEDEDIRDNYLQEISDMYLTGASYQTIADSLEEPCSRTTVMRRLDKIRKKYPWLLERDSEGVTHVTDNENVNDNDDGNESDSADVNESGSAKDKEKDDGLMLFGDESRREFERHQEERKKFKEEDEEELAEIPEDVLQEQFDHYCEEDERLAREAEHYRDKDEEDCFPW